MGPVSLATIVCWICSEAFKTQRELKNHLIARPHERMRVICPWCPLKEGKKEKTLRRMSDLKGHIQEQHRDISLSKFPSDFFSEANGFYLGIYPKDYVRIVSPSSYRGEAATIARGEVLRWLKDTKRSEKERERWMRDWGIARQETGKRPYTPEEEFLPDYDECMPEKRGRQYSPSRPSMSDWAVKLIKVTGSTSTVYVIGGDTTYELLLQPGLWKDAKTFSSLMRRTEQPCYNQHFESPSTWEDVELTDSGALVRDLAFTAGIPANTITTVKRACREEFQPSTTEVDMVETLLPLPHIDEPPKELPEERTCPSPSLALPSGKLSCSAPATPCYHPTSTISRTPESVSEVISASNSCHLSTAYSEGTSTGPRRIAFELLSTGCMPLLPPAKRDWTNVRLDIPCGTSTITWPPENWPQMNADQRLLQWEYAAMQLNSTYQHQHILDRLELLNHYNMLALPGTAVPSIKPSPVHKMRFYNFDVLRKIAISSTCSESDTIVIRQFTEAAKHRDKRTDDLTLFLKLKNVKLRL